MSHIAVSSKECPLRAWWNYSPHACLQAKYQNCLSMSLLGFHQQRRRTPHIQLMLWFLCAKDCNTAALQCSHIFLEWDWLPTKTQHTLAAWGGSSSWDGPLRLRQQKVQIRQMFLFWCHNRLDCQQRITPLNQGWPQLSHLPAARAGQKAQDACGSCTVPLGFAS